MFLFFTIQPPPALYQGAVAAGAKKAQNSFANIFKLGIVAGCHIAFGAFLVLSVGAACPGIASSNPGLQKVSNASFFFLSIITIFLHDNVLSSDLNNFFVKRLSWAPLGCHLV